MNIKNCLHFNTCCSVMSEQLSNDARFIIKHQSNLLEMLHFLLRRCLTWTHMSHHRSSSQDKCDWCLTEEMKTLYESVNHAAGMCNWAHVWNSWWYCQRDSMWSRCLSGSSVSAPHHDWLSCLLVGLWWLTESLMSCHWGFCNEKFHFCVTRSLQSIFINVRSILWCNTLICAWIIQTFGVILAIV